MTVIEAIDELDQKLSELPAQTPLTVEQGCELLLCCRRLELWCQNITTHSEDNARSINELLDELGMTDGRP